MFARPGIELQRTIVSRPRELDQAPDQAPGPEGGLHIPHLIWSGAGFFALAGFFLWRDLNLGSELILVPAAVVTVGAALARRPSGLPNLGTWGLLICAIGGGAWYAAVTPPLLLWGLGATFAAAIAVVATAPKGPSSEALAARSWAWRTWVASCLAFSFGCYFQFLTLGLAADQLSRRLVLTATWLATGLVLFVVGRVRRRGEIVEAGTMVAAAALLKALLYDTTHLGGGLRVAAMAVAGGLLFAAAAALARLTRAAREVRDA